MNIIKTLILATLAVPVLALAQTNTPRVDQREANQQQRIDQGVASGSLTQREANRMERGQQHVENMETRAKADGVMTRGERVRMHEAQDRESARIFRQKHDAQHDYNHNGRVDRPLRR